MLSNCRGWIEFDYLPKQIFFFNVVPITVTDKEPSKSKHMSIPAEGSLLLFCQTTSTPQPPPAPHPSPPPVLQCIVGQQINKTRRRRRRSPVLSLHNRDVCFSRPAEAQELIHPPCESDHFKKREKGKRKKYDASP